MVYFDQSFLDFYEELAHNNHKTWFDANRKRYEAVVKKPFRVFISDVFRSGALCRNPGCGFPREP